MGKSVKEGIMPRNIIVPAEARMDRLANAAGTPLPAELPPGVENTSLGLSIGWNKTGWVQLHMFPFGWESTSEWHIVDLSRGDCNELIRQVRLARDKAYGKDE